MASVGTNMAASASRKQEGMLESFGNGYFFCLRNPPSCCSPCMSSKQKNKGFIACQTDPTEQKREAKDKCALLGLSLPVLSKVNEGTTSSLERLSMLSSIHSQLSLLFDVAVHQPLMEEEYEKFQGDMKIRGVDNIAHGSIKPTQPNHFDPRSGLYGDVEKNVSDICRGGQLRNELLSVLKRYVLNCSLERLVSSGAVSEHFSTNQYFLRDGQRDCSPYVIERESMCKDVNLENFECGTDVNLVGQDFIPAISSALQSQDENLDFVGACSSNIDRSSLNEIPKLEEYYSLFSRKPNDRFGMFLTKKCRNLSSKPNKPNGASQRNLSKRRSVARGSSVYSRGSTARHRCDPFSHNVMIKLIQPLPTGIKLELKFQKGSQRDGQNLDASEIKAGLVEPREYALRVSLTRHETKYCSFHSFKGILPAYNEAVRLRNRYSGLPFNLPFLLTSDLEERKTMLDMGIDLPAHGPREAFMTVQKRAVFYKQSKIFGLKNGIHGPLSGNETLNCADIYIKEKGNLKGSSGFDSPPFDFRQIGDSDMNNKALNCTVRQKTSRQLVPLNCSESDENAFEMRCEKRKRRFGTDNSKELDLFGDRIQLFKEVLQEKFHYTSKEVATECNSSLLFSDKVRTGQITTTSPFTVNENIEFCSENDMQEDEKPRVEIDCDRSLHYCSADFDTDLHVNAEFGLISEATSFDSVGNTNNGSEDGCTLVTNEQLIDLLHCGNKTKGIPRGLSGWRMNEIATD